MTLEAQRRPPHFVPTLTDVVRAPPPVPAPDDDGRQRLIDAVSDRVLAALQPRLQQVVVAEVQRWMAQQESVLAERVAQSLLDEVAQVCRLTAEDMLLALEPIEPESPAGVSRT